MGLVKVVARTLVAAVTTSGSRGISVGLRFVRGMIERKNDVEPNRLLCHLYIHTETTFSTLGAYLNGLVF